MSMLGTVRCLTMVLLPLLGVSSSPTMLLAQAVHADGPLMFSGPQRYEIGRRYRRFETAWEAAPPDLRVAALPTQRLVITAYFVKNLPEAARHFDAARRILAAESERSPSPGQLWAESLLINPHRRLFDAADDGLDVELSEFYPNSGTRPNGWRARLSLLDRGGRLLQPVTEFERAMLPARLSLPLGQPGAFGQPRQPLPTGDHTLRLELFASDWVRLAEHEITVSVASGVSARLADLAEAVRPDRETRSLEQGLLNYTVPLLRRLAAGAHPETDYPAAELLGQAETVFAALRAGQPWLGPHRSGQLWLKLPLTGAAEHEGLTSVTVRVFVPSGLRSDRPVPMVVALHGANGSENMFFDASGAGELVRLAARRGWLVVGPRAGFFNRMPVAAIIDALAERLPVDKSRVVAVGHSMGALQSLQAAQRTPARLAAVVALGGGGQIDHPAVFTKLPVFIAAGDGDFALANCQRLYRDLSAVAGVRVRFHEYPDTDHITVIPRALPAAFEFLDTVLPGPFPSPR